MMVLSLSPILGNVKDGKLFALAVTTPDRSKLLPDVPTIAKSTLPGFSAAIRYGLAAPAGTSAAIVDRLARELRAAVMSEDVRERMLSEGAQPMASTPAEYAAEIELRRAKVVGVGQEPQFEDGVTASLSVDGRPNQAC